MMSKEELLEETERPRKNPKKLLIIFIVTIIFIAVIFFLIGYFAKSTKPAKCHEDDSQDKEKLYKSIVDQLQAGKIEENLRYFSKQPHPASFSRNNELIKEIHRRFQSYGFETTYHPYDVLLSFPNPNKRNFVYIVDQNGKEVFKSKGIEDFLEPSEKVASAFGPFLAFAPAGTVEGELVFVNYGRYADFEKLEKDYKVNVSGKIVIAKYGKIFRGDKVMIAQERGAIGVILYSDPKDTAPDEGEKYIKGRWLPDDGVQRGSILKTDYKDIGQGDPLTPGYPSKDWAYHSDQQNLKGLPQIPAQPVSAYDAYHLMKYSRKDPAQRVFSLVPTSLTGHQAGWMKWETRIILDRDPKRVERNLLNRNLTGATVSSDWEGDLNITYRVSGPYAEKNRKVKLTVFNERKRKTVTNVCGTIKGKVEPDRYVLFGNHIDAWVFGAVDPSSGTSVMMEIARVLGETMKTGWRPRRTIKFCGWDAEEQWLIGSSEYVEEYRNQLRDRAVAYINLDIAANGNESLQCWGSPLLHEMIFEANKKVNDPFDESLTVFDQAKATQPDKDYPDTPRIGGLGSGSDFTSFYQFLGIPSIHMMYRSNVLNRRLNVSQSYPMYHSLHDTFYWVKHFVDRDFTVHLTVGRAAMYYLLYLADKLVVPFNAKRYDEKLNRDANKLIAKLKDSVPKTSQVNGDPLLSATNNFTVALNAFTERMKKVNLQNPIELRMLNDQLIQLEKGFIYVDGLPGRPYLKHYIMAPSKYNAYGASQFPAISDTLFEAKKTGDWDQVEKQLSITTFLIQNVADTLASLT